MLTNEQIQKILSENDHLRVQLNEANEILALREEEIEILKQNDTDIAELRSQMEGQLNQAHSLQNIIGQKQKQAFGAAKREQELEDELIDASKLLHKYSDLKQHYTHLSIKINDLEEQLVVMNKRNETLENLLNKQ